MAKWLSKVEGCDLCKKDLNKEEFFVDGKTVYGPWGLLCMDCHSKFGAGLGTGYGQKYRTSDREKVEG